MINSDYLKNLNKAQKEAVLYLDGPLLIVAGAGSGKTKVLTSRIAHIIKEKKAFPNQILSVTFTNKAAKEMKERILQYLHTLSQQQDVDNILHEIKLKTQLSEKLIFKYSKDLYSYIIHNYSDLGI